MANNNNDAVNENQPIHATGWFKRIPVQRQMLRKISGCFSPGIWWISIIRDETSQLLFSGSLAIENGHL